MLRLVEDADDDPMELLMAALRSGQPEVVLSGFAGAGKTTLVKQLSGGKIGYAAPTNKAARRLAEVTGREVTTIHSLIYGQAREEWVKPSGKVCGGYDDDDGVSHPAPGCPGCQCSSRLRFGAPRELDDVTLLVIDEASMVGRQTAADIRRAVSEMERDVQVLWVGDPAQLPPVMDTPGVDLDEADVMLTHVWRADGGILALATAIRTAESLDDIDAIVSRAAMGEFPDVVVARGGVNAVAEWRIGAPERMAITHTNKDRQGVNARVRHLLEDRRRAAGRAGQFVAGDRLLVRQNVRNGDGPMMMVNSEVYAVTRTEPLDDCVAVHATLDGERGIDRRFIVAPEYLGEHGNDAFGRQSRMIRISLERHTTRCSWCRGVSGVEAVCSQPGWFDSLALDGAVEGDGPACEPVEGDVGPACAGSGIVGDCEVPTLCRCGPYVGWPLVNCQYGFAMTAHVAQGSEAEEVGVLWTPWSHRRDFATARSWLYTAVTRARSSLRIWR